MRQVLRRKPLEQPVMQWRSRHMADHELGAAAYAIRAARAAVDSNVKEEAGRSECRWQRAQLPDAIRNLVMDDQRLRNEKCWHLFDR